MNEYVNTLITNKKLTKKTQGIQEWHLARSPTQDTEPFGSVLSQNNTIAETANKLMFPVFQEGL